ncbi:MAG: alkaline phosphatase family protein [Solirubrobacteraceae bacterium]
MSPAVRRRSRKRKKLVLAVIDGLRPSILEAAVADGRAPALARLMADGVYFDDCVAAFPSVTPVCTSTIATGAGPGEHNIPAMNWFLRGEARYVEYGSSFQASRTFGIQRSLTDTIYNLNMAHLSRATPTFFEELDDAGVRTAGTTFLIYRGRHRHAAGSDSALARLVSAALFRHAVYGPRELFYADLFASRRTGCRSQLGLPGARDAHAGCVGAYMVEHDLFDFMLFSLPDNDTHSHKRGPDAQEASVALADEQLARLMDAAGGPDAFLADHAVIVLADHAHSLVEEPIVLASAFERRVLRPDDPEPELAEIAVCPGQRAAMAYVLDPAERDAILPELVEAAANLAGVDVVLWRDGEEAVARSGRAELRFVPGGELSDPRGERWSLRGDTAVLDARVQEGGVRTPDYPDALGRAWSALSCVNAGDILLSAAPGHEFIDWGGAGHLGGGSHGSLHREDSLGPLIWTGTGPADRDARAQWTLRDVAPMVREHFGL